MNIGAKIKEYENFLEDKLKQDLKDIERVLLNKSNELKDWTTLKNTVTAAGEFKEKDIDMCVSFNMGNNINCFGHVVNYENIYVDIGLGYLLEMNFEESLKYSDLRIKLLEKEISHLRKLAVNVKVHIKMVLLAINELKTTLKQK